MFYDRNGVLVGCLYIHYNYMKQRMTYRDGILYPIRKIIKNKVTFSKVIVVHLVGIQPIFSW